jgi:mono/diheme cytochrome c family protein
MKKVKTELEKRKSAKPKLRKTNKVLPAGKMSKTEGFKNAILFIPALLLTLLVPGVWVYGQEEEAPKPMPAVPQEYRGKHMPDGWWTNPDIIAKGEKIYQEGVEITNSDGSKEIQRCAQCHGASGKPKLKGARDLRQPERINKFSDSFWFWRISEGVPETKMPSWKDLLTEEQRWHVMAYEHQYSHGGQSAAHQHAEAVSLDGEK